MTTTLNDLLMVAVPQRTATYQPVTHFALVDMVKEAIDKRGFKIVQEDYTTNRHLTQLFAKLSIEAFDSEQRMMVGFRNSYDKSLAVGLVAGSSVIVCSNLMLKGDVKVLRKHSANVFNDLGGLITETVDVAYEELESNIGLGADLKRIEMPRVEMARVAGDMFINRNLINAEQMSIVKREINESQFFKGQTRWDFYNHLTEALKTAHPLNAMQRHIDVTDYVVNL
jgi:hypothetical protein